VRQNGHFWCLNGSRFSQQSLAGTQMHTAPTIQAAARSPHNNTSDCPIPRSSSAEKVIRHCEFSEKCGIWRGIIYQMLQLKMHGF
jgi:hypothetical protein